MRQSLLQQTTLVLAVALLALTGCDSGGEEGQKDFAPANIEVENEPERQLVGVFYNQQGWVGHRIDKHPLTGATSCVLEHQSEDGTRLEIHADFYKEKNVYLEPKVYLIRPNIQQMDLISQVEVSQQFFTMRRVFVDAEDHVSLVQLNQTKSLLEAMAEAAALAYVPAGKDKPVVMSFSAAGFDEAMRGMNATCEAKPLDFSQFQSAF